MIKTPQIGTQAPAFTALVIGGDYKFATEIQLADFKGQTVVLYFYPKDATPGCTTQACAIRDGWTGISEKALVFGISVDSIKSHEKFIKKQDLPFPLISDEQHFLAESYGVWVEKSMYGKSYMGIERSTFVIGKDGKIKGILSKFKPHEHFAQLLTLL